jgi:hypothetical protein
MTAGVSAQTEKSASRQTAASGEAWWLSELQAPRAAAPPTRHVMIPEWKRLAMQGS